MEYIIIAAVIIIVAWMGFIKPIRYMTVYEYEKGLKFAKGKFEQTLEPGAY